MQNLRPCRISVRADYPSFQNIRLCRIWALAENGCESKFLSLNITGLLLNKHKLLNVTST